MCGAWLQGGANDHHEQGPTQTPRPGPGGDRKAQERDGRTIWQLVGVLDT
jgi:hypothetical protein